MPSQLDVNEWYNLSTSRNARCNPEADSEPNQDLKTPIVNLSFTLTLPTIPLPPHQPFFVRVRANLVENHSVMRTTMTHTNRG